MAFLAACGGGEIGEQAAKQTSAADERHPTGNEHHTEGEELHPAGDDMLKEVALDPNAPPSEVQKLIVEKQYSKAESLLSLAIDSGRVPSQSLMERARLYRTMGKYQKAVDDCDRIMRIDATSTEVLKERAGIYKLMGKDQEAADDLAELNYEEKQSALHKAGKQSLTPDTVPNGLSQVEYYHLARKYGGVHPKEALECITLAEKMNPKSRFAERATKLRDTMLPKVMPPDEAIELNILAYKYISNPDRCQALLDKCIGKYPNFECAYITLAAMKKDSRQIENAESALRQALKINPHNVEALSRLGEVLSFNNIEEAKQVWRQAVALDPEDSFDGALLEGYKNDK